MSIPRSYILRIPTIPPDLTAGYVSGNKWIKTRMRGDVDGCSIPTNICDDGVIEAFPIDLDDVVLTMFADHGESVGNLPVTLEDILAVPLGGYSMPFSQTDENLKVRLVVSAKKKDEFNEMLCKIINRLGEGGRVQYFRVIRDDTNGYYQGFRELQAINVQNLAWGEYRSEFEWEITLQMVRVFYPTSIVSELEERSKVAKVFEYSY